MGIHAPTDNTKRICLWSGPRNISTAMMYSFAQRGDTIVYDEPLYAAYLANNHEAIGYHPGADEILETMENDPARVVEMMLGPQPAPVAFFKQMTHHLSGMDWAFLEYTTNLILTRDPREMLPSYAKQVKHPTMRDVGYAMHMELLEYLHSIGQEPVVIDSRKVLLDPTGVLQMLCQKVGIPFDPAMLHWEKGSIPEDGVWAKYWYHTLHESTGFQPYNPKSELFPEHLRPLLDECLPYYEELSALSISTPATGP